MSDERNGGGPAEPRDVDPGEPIGVLEDFEHPVGPGFITTLHRKIERRSLTGQFVTLTWHVPLMIVLEFLAMAFGVFKDDKGDSP